MCPLQKKVCKYLVKNISLEMRQNGIILVCRQEAANIWHLHIQHVTSVIKLFPINEYNHTVVLQSSNSFQIKSALVEIGIETEPTINYLNVNMAKREMETNMSKIMITPSELPFSWMS